MSQPNRRVFLMTVVGSSAVLGSAAQAQTVVDEKEPLAVNFAYVADAKRVDAKKQPKFVAGAHCGNCALYQGKPADKTGPCPLFGTKHVAAAGWCNAWVKKG